MEKATKPLPRMEVIQINGTGHTMAEARKALGLADDECVGCFIGDDGTAYTHCFTDACDAGGDGACD